MTLIPGQPVANSGEYGAPRVSHVACNAENQALYYRADQSTGLPPWPLDARTLTQQAGVTPPD